MQSFEERQCNRLKRGERNLGRNEGVAVASTSTAAALASARNWWAVNSRIITTHCTRTSTTTQTDLHFAASPPFPFDSILQLCVPLLYLVHSPFQSASRSTRSACLLSLPSYVFFLLHLEMSLVVYLSLFLAHAVLYVAVGRIAPDFVGFQTPSSPLKNEAGVIGAEVVGVVMASEGGHRSSISAEENSGEGLASSRDATSVSKLNIRDSSAIATFCKEWGVSLVVVGPEGLSFLASSMI